jgi:cell volume regulation protein A
MSVFLTVALIEALLRPGLYDAPGQAGFVHAGLLFAAEMGGGTVIGLGGGYALLRLLRRLKAEDAVFPPLVLATAVAIFGGAQSVGASGFLAVYLTGAILGNADHPAAKSVHGFFAALGWLAQVSLFLMLGLLVTPHELPAVVVPALAVTAALILVARPVAVAACLLPFGWGWREAGFVAWVGLRGAVPMYLTIFPILAGLRYAHALFGIVFVVVIVSVAAQGWTIRPVARLLGLDRVIPSAGGLSVGGG